MASAFQNLAFQQAPAFQTGATAPATTPGRKLSGEYTFDVIAREQRQRLLDQEEARRIVVPAPAESDAPEQPILGRSREQQRADAERRLFEQAQEAAQRERLALAERLRLAEIEQKRVALVAAHEQRMVAIALQIQLDGEAAQAFFAFMMDMP